MADTSVISIISTYQERINKKPYVPSTTYALAKLDASVVPNKLFLEQNKLFLALLFSDNDVGVQFWKYVGLIPSYVVYCKCGLQMSWCVDGSVKNGYRWRCWRSVSASACRASISVSHGTWFQQSNLNVMEVLLLTYIVRSVPAHAVQQEHHFGSGTITEWAKLCRGVMLPSATRKTSDINYY